MTVKNFLFYFLIVLLFSLSEFGLTFATDLTAKERSCGTVLPQSRAKLADQLGITVPDSRELYRHEFPWAVSLGTLDGAGHYQHSCGGALLSDRWILTSALCLTAEIDRTFVAVIGK